MLRGKVLLAYVAGIIDGEGCIGIKTNGSQKTGAKFVIRVSIGHTSEWLISMIHMQFGGSLYLKYAGSEHHKPAWGWELSSRKAESFLKLILPYLQIKRPQAELALSFQHRKVPGHRNEAQAAIDVANKIVMTAMNRKGGKLCPI